MSVAAIILAAGRGSRFGTAPKLLALLRGKPLIRHAAEAALASAARPILVVTGHLSDVIEAALADLDGLTILRNPDHADGMSTSLRAGFAALPAEAEGAVVLLGDMPLVGGGLIDRLIAEWRGSGAAALVPVHEGRRGNPVLLGRGLAPDIARLSGDHGAGPLLRGRNDVAELVIDDPAVTLDIDTEAALAQARTTPSRTAE